jgi:hypothetical protein
MKIHWIKLAGVTLILLIAGCIEQEKEDFTLPVRVHFRIGYKPDYDGQNVSKDGEIGIQDIQFEGIREAGGNVYFETDPNTDWPHYKFNAMESICDYNLPQGIFKYMRWDITLKRIETQKLSYIDDDLVSYIDDDLDSLSIGLILYGFFETGLVYTDEWGLPQDLFIPVIIAIDDKEELVARFTKGITLSADKDYEAHVLLSASALSSVNYEGAEITGEGESKRIIITSNKNEDLYEKILYQLLRSVRVDIVEISPST